MLDPEDLAEWWGSSEQDQQDSLQQSPLFNGLLAQIEHMGGRGCKCTRSHAYRACPRFSEHFWIWLAEESGPNDVCACPPADESLLMLECPKLIQHIHVCSYPLLCGRIVLTIIPRMNPIEISRCRTLLGSLANVHAQRRGNIFPLGVVFTGSTWIMPERARRARTQKIP